MVKEYEVVAKDFNDDWNTIKNGIRTLRAAVKVALRIHKQYKVVDINLIVDGDLKETYNEKGEAR